MPSQDVRLSVYLSVSATVELIVTILGELTDAEKRMNPQHFGSDPADTGSESGLIQKSGFESRITFG